MSDEFPTLDLTAYNYDHPPFGMDAVRKLIPHRYEFEMLSGVVYTDRSQHLVVGFKDLRADEFWAKGHMPGFPLFPGVLMCEAGAQLCAFYYAHAQIGPPNTLLGLAAIEQARFTRPARPGERLVLVGMATKIHRRLLRFRTAGYVGSEKTFEALVTGVPLGNLEELRRA